MYKLLVSDLFVRFFLEVVERGVFVFGFIFKESLNFKRVKFKKLSIGKILMLYFFTKILIGSWRDGLVVGSVDGCVFCIFILLGIVFF